MGDIMLFLKYSAIILLSFSVLIMLIFYFLGGKPFKAIFLNAIIGIGVLGLIDLSAEFTGVFIPINEFTVSLSSVFGIPAVFLMLILQIIIL